MPSSPSNSLRLEEQFTGENVNLWGVLLNQVIAMLDSGIAGMATVALTANTTLSSINFVADQARNAILKLTGSAPWVVTIPSVSKLYVVWNASSAIQTITTGAGATATVQPGEVVLIACDTSNVMRVVATDYGTARITGVGDPIGAQDAATRAYVDATAFIANAGILPGQGGHNGHPLFSNGTNALWRAFLTTDISDFASNILGVQVALAVAL